MLHSKLLATLPQGVAQRALSYVCSITGRKCKTTFSLPLIINKKGLKDTVTRLQYKLVGLRSSSGIGLHYGLEPSLFAF